MTNGKFPIWYQCQTKKVTLPLLLGQLKEHQINLVTFEAHLFFILYFASDPYHEGYHFLQLIMSSLCPIKTTGMIRYYLLYLLLFPERIKERVLEFDPQSLSLKQFFNFRVATLEVYRQLQHILDSLVGPVVLSIPKNMEEQVKDATAATIWLNHLNIHLEDPQLLMLSQINSLQRYLLGLIARLRNGGPLESLKILCFLYPKWSKNVVTNEEICNKLHEVLDSYDYRFLDQYLRECKPFWGHYPSFQALCQRLLRVDNDLDAERIRECLEPLAAEDRSRYIPTMFSKVTWGQVENFLAEVKQKGFEETFKRYHQIYVNDLHRFIQEQGLDLNNRTCLVGNEIEQYPFAILNFYGKQPCYVLTNREISESDQLNPYNRQPIKEAVNDDDGDTFLENWSPVLQRELKP